MNCSVDFKMPDFGQPLRQTKILFLEILKVCLRLKFSSSLTLAKLGHFETDSLCLPQTVRRRFLVQPSCDCSTGDL